MSTPTATAALSTGGGTSYFQGSGITASGGKYQAAPVTTLGQFLDLYIVHFVVAVVFVVGGIMLAISYSETTSGSPSTWQDLFYVIGALSFAMNAAFGLGIVIAWINKSAGALSRQDDSIHWLHALSIFAAASGALWGVLALALTFGTALIDTNSPSSATGGYFMVLFAEAYFVYLVVRYMFGLAGAKTEEPKKSDALPVDYGAASRAVSAAAGVSSQPFFGGGGRYGSAAFGGIDLGGLGGGDSSMTTTIPAAPASQQQPQMLTGGGGGTTQVFNFGGGIPQQPFCSPGQVTIA